MGCDRQVCSHSCSASRAIGRSLKGAAQELSHLPCELFEQIFKNAVKKKKKKILVPSTGLVNCQMSMLECMAGKVKQWKVGKDSFTVRCFERDDQKEKKNLSYSVFTQNI